MKRVHELTHEELIALDDAGIQTLIDLEVAHAGIKPEADPGEAPTVDPNDFIKPTEYCYEVGSLKFKDEEDAKIVAQMSPLDYDYDGAAGYNFKWLKPGRPSQVERCAFYKEADVKRLAVEIQEAETLKSDFDKRMKAYKGYREEVYGVEGTVWDRANEARRFQREIEMATVAFEKHKILADGVVIIAERFFADAYRDHPNIIEKVLGRPVEPPEKPEENEDDE